ncbi:TniQ family protein [Azospirillum sp. HJ39]|uniref:TniQ family protein n=1 Tax=Azospirillum sp. HJ39 TaxID=3159496 RepID=UPI003557F790
MKLQKDYTTPNRIVIRSDLVHGESVNGYLRRLSIANCYEGIHWILSNIISSKEEVYYEDNLVWISRITGIKYEFFRKSGYVSVSKERQYVNFYGIKILKKHFEFTRQKICTACFREKPVFQSVWDISAWIACPVHGNQLIDRCPECGRLLSWSRAAYTCECGAFDYDDYFTGKSHENAISCSRHISFLLFGKKENENTGLNDRIRKINLEELLSIISDLYMMPIIEDRSGKISYRSLYNNYNECLIYSMGILIDWPDGFYEHVERVIKATLTFRNAEEENHLGYRLLLCVSFLERMKSIEKTIDEGDDLWIENLTHIVVKAYHSDI